MIPEPETLPLKHLREAHILLVPAKNILIVRAIAEFISFDKFKQIFNEVGKLAQQKEITKLIFDKRSLRVFEPESMEWYYVRWKEEMVQYGLTTHRKIMPNDTPFKFSVDASRHEIIARHPKAVFHRLDIQYVDSVEEGIKR